MESVNLELDVKERVMTEDVPILVDKEADICNHDSEPSAFRSWVVSLQSITEPFNVVVSSTNPVKVNAVRIALATCFPDCRFEISSRAVTSAVSDQPMSTEETKQGAINRARNGALASTNQTDRAAPLLSIGIEGGLDYEYHSLCNGAADKSMVCFAWVAVYCPPRDKWGIARTGCFPLPKALQELVEGGTELGHADDLLFRRTDSKTQGGTVGYLSKGLISRTDYYVHAMILALTVFLNPDLYP